MSAAHDDHGPLRGTPQISGHAIDAQEGEDPVPEEAQIESHQHQHPIAAPLPDVAEQEHLMPHASPNQEIHNDPKDVSTAWDSSKDAQEVSRTVWPLMWDVTLLLLPLVFLALGILAVILNGGKTTSKPGRDVQRALLLAPTVFPIVFAALVGRFMRSTGLYMSQKGLELRVLEHLIGAQSIFSALERQVLLRNFRYFGMLVTLFWALSPLGGQSLLRLLATEPSRSTYTKQVQYLSPAIFGDSDLLSGAGFAYARPTISAAYFGALLTPIAIQSSFQDVWGNPKVPSPESCDLPVPGQPDWYGFGIGRNVSYLNLVGIPLEGIDSALHSHFIVDSVSANFKCHSNSLTTDQVYLENVEPLEPPSGVEDLTAESLWLDVNNDSITFFLHVTTESWQAFSLNASQPLRVYYGSRTYDGIPDTATETACTDDSGCFISLAVCDLFIVPLEANVTCDDRNCKVDAIRRAVGLLDKYNVSVSLYDAAVGGPGSWITLAPAIHSDQGSLTEFFLQDPASVLGKGIFTNYAQLWKLPKEVIEERLTLVFNAWWYSTTTKAFITGIDAAPQVQLMPDADRNVSLVNNVTAVVTEDGGTIYVCQTVWLGITLAVCLALEAAAIANLVVRRLTVVPDVLGFASSMTMENPYCIREGIQESSALDGLERARALGNVRVRLADVRSQAGVGHIAFVPVGGKGCEDVQEEGDVQGDVKLKRKYD